MTDSPATDDNVRLTGACPCCGGPTKVLFAMGHDARFRSRLVSSVVEAGGWEGAKVGWVADTAEVITVGDALRRVGRLIGRDWTAMVSGAVARSGLALGPLDPPVTIATFTSKPKAPRTELNESTARDAAVERVDSLMSRLRAVPHAGEWGWFTDGNGKRFPARVLRTRRDQDSSLIDLVVYTNEANSTARTLEHVSPDTWVRDDAARDAS